MSDIDSVDMPSWPEILRAVQDQLARRIHTSLPAVVQSYDSATQRATVELTVQLDGVTLPPIAEVPVCWPGNLHATLADGDAVLVVFCEEDWAKWYDTGSVPSAPAVLVRHGLHAIAVPGLHRSAAPLAVTGGHSTLIADELRLGSDSAVENVVLESSPFTWKSTFDTWAAALPSVGVPLTDTVFKAAMQALGTALSSAGFPSTAGIATKVKAE